jgi:16S rRNA (adenine(1408)-N(1))-methyltransferase
VRRLLGKTVSDLSDEDFVALCGPYGSMVMDVGTGNGKHAYQLARRNPESFVVGLDANPDNMRRTAAKAAGSARKGGLPNLVYLWESVERMPTLPRPVTQLHVLMPWGSLLRGLLDDSLFVLDNLRAVCADGAEFLIALNLHAWRPAVPEVGDSAEPTPQSAMAELAERYKARGWDLTEAKYLDSAEIDALETSWTKRLNSSRQQLDVLALTGTTTR